MPKATLKLIAKTLGISTSTVSKALKDYPDINSETKLKVKKLAESLHYVPNSFAQGLRSKESKIIGLLVPDLVHHFFSSIIKGVISEAAKHGYLVVVLESNESYKNEVKQLQLLSDKNIDGILLSISDSTTKYNHINEILKEGVPIVLFDKVSHLIDCSKVIINDREAAFKATEYLIKTGCKTIAYITGPLNPKTTIDRFMGYKKALQEYDIPYNKSLVYTSENVSFNDGYELTKQILIDHPNVDGIFGFIDPIAIGVLKRLNEDNIKVPDQVSVIGFSNWFMTKTTSPTLTTIDQPGEKMGKKAFELLIDNLKQVKAGELPILKTIEIPTSIIVRDSTRPII